jgi:hypothetical protein
MSVLTVNPSARGRSPDRIVVRPLAGRELLRQLARLLGGKPALEKLGRCLLDLADRFAPDVGHDQRLVIDPRYRLLLDDLDERRRRLSDPRFRGQPITWGVTSEGYDAVRRAWLTHVQAEEVLFKPFTEDEFMAQMEVMLGVFTDDCVMELVTTGERWEGDVEAAEFYRI